VNPDPQSPNKSPLKNPLLYSSIVVLAVAAYVAFTVISRYESNRAFARQEARKVADQKREDDRVAIEQLGGSELAIRSLYVDPAEIHPGESAQLCYDVANAKTVTLDPPAGEVWPSHFRCLPVSPKKTTAFTLTIADAQGQKVTQSVKLKVR
jgi:hypothetical protein